MVAATVAFCFYAVKGNSFNNFAMLPLLFAFFATASVDNSEAPRVSVVSSGPVTTADGPVKTADVAVVDLASASDSQPFDLFGTP